MLVATAAAQVLWAADAAFVGAAAGLLGGGCLSLLLARRVRLTRWLEPILVEIHARQDVAAGHDDAALR